jgi:hypothetical protein
MTQPIPKGIYPWEKGYFLAVCEAREMAFLKWQRSAYRDIAAHDAYLQWRDQAMKFAHEVNGR